MASKSRSKKGNKSAPKNKKVGANGGGVIQNLGSGGTPSMVRMTLKYSASIAMSTSTVLSQVFRGNGPYDPDVTGTGGQPYNYDDWAILYNRYRVHACMIKWKFVPAQNGHFRVVCTPTNSSSAWSSADNVISAPRSKWQGGWSSTSTVDGSTPLSQIVQRATTSSILGEEKGDRFQSLYNTTPADPWYWFLLLESSDGSTTIAGRMLVELHYTMDWFDRLPETIDLLERKQKMLQQKIKVKRAGDALVKHDAESKLVGPQNDSTEKKAQFPPEASSLTDVRDSGDYVVIKRSSLKGARVHARTLAAGASRVEDPD